MARVLNIYPRNVFAALEFNVDQLKQIQWFMDHCSVEFSSEDADQKAAVEYVSETLCPLIRDVLDQVDGGEH